MSNILATTYDAALAVTVSDSTADPAGPFAGLLVITAGTVKFTDQQGNTTTCGSLAAGTVIPVVVSRVWSTGTAGAVVGLRAEPYRPRASS